MYKYLYFALCLSFTSVSYSQTWELTSPDKIANKGQKDINPTVFKVYNVDNEVIKSILWAAPLESTRVGLKESNTLIYVPMPDGTLDQFRMIEYAIGEKKLMEKFPDLKTFYGVSISNPYRVITADFTAFGFKAMISTPGESAVFVDNYQMGDYNNKIVYYKKDNPRRERWFCGVKDEDFNRSAGSNRSLLIGDCKIREYRLALSVTGEYTDFYIPGPSPPTAADSTATNIALVHSAVVTSVNRVNGVYMQELGIRCILVANNNILYYFNPTTDGYTNTNGTTMLGQNQTKTDARIGTANYDIGHVFSTGGGGVASLNSPCSAGSKARGVTGSGAPVGDAFDIDYVAHEMGHQFGGNHTFAGSALNCGGANRNNSTAFEPGSGSSIMAYAGICSPENVQNNSDATFHAISLQELKTFLLGGGGCGQVVNPPGNTSPNVLTPASTFNIPVSTPFALTLNATDNENNPLTYAWDQMNGVTGNVTTPPASTNIAGPMFRNIVPSTSTTRYFPNLTGILAGLTTSASGWEVLPSVARVMNFRGVVRDFTGLFGCNSEVNMVVNTIAAAGPFSITSNNSASTWLQGETRNITWNVAGTTANGINVAAVDVLYTTNNGSTFSTLLSGVSNDGSQNIVVPSANTTTGRYMVKAVGNVFLDINNADITITNGSPTYSLALDTYIKALCLGQSYVFTVTVSGFGGYSTPVNLSLSGLPAGMTASFSNNVVIPGNTTQLTITNTSAVSGLFSLSLDCLSGAINNVMDFTIQSLLSVAPFSLTSPVNNATAQIPTPTFSWEAATNATSYQFQLSRKSDFSSTILNIQGLVSTSYTPVTDLLGFSEYFWRVRAGNDCGFGPWTGAFKFETELCLTTTSANVPVVIPTIPAIVNSTMTIGNARDKGTINDLDIKKLIGTHTYVDDLSFTLFGPNNTPSVLFWARPCNSEDNFNINFDQASLSNTTPCPPTTGVTIRPSGTGVGTLNTFNTINFRGSWKMQVQDFATDDGGSLDTWKLRTCITNFCRLTVDNDFEKGAGSLLAAINCAVDGDTIKFASTFMNDSITLFESNIVTNKRIFIESDIAKNIHIFSNSASPTIVSSTPNSGAGLKIKGLHIHASNSAGIGAIQNSGLLTLEDVILYKGLNSSQTIQNESGGKNDIIGNCKVIP